MTNERLEQIKDNVDFRLSAEKHLKIDKEVILEEKELLNEIDRLRNINKNAVEYIKEDIYVEPKELYGLVDGEHLLNILEGKDE